MPGSGGRSQGQELLSRTRTGALALIAITTLGLAIPALGNAAVVRVLGPSLRIDGFAGETNVIEVRYQPSSPSQTGTLGPRLLVDDPVGSNALGTLCFEVSFETASCDAAGVQTIDAGLADGNDALVIANAGPEAVPASYPASIRGGIGNDVIKTGAGDDRVLGDVGKDSLAGGLGDDRINGGPGTDGLVGFGGDDILAGGPGNDGIFGQKGRDEMSGGDGNDVIVARDGKPDERIDCGPGSPERALVDREDPRPVSCTAAKPGKPKQP